MKSLLTACFLFATVAGWAQAPTIVRTDSSRIVSRLYPGGKEVKEWVTGKDRVHYRFYRDNRTTVTTTSTYTKAGRPVGTTREYDDHGTLRYAIDHDHGQWLVPDPRAYPDYALLAHIKAKADRLVAAVYGQRFLHQYAVWNVWGSAVYHGTLGGNWTDVLAETPTQFLVRYDIHLDDAHVYPELIELKLDTDGNFMPEESDEVYGFERLNTFPAHGMDLVYGEALATAKKKSGATSQPLTGFLAWERIQDALWQPPGLYNGQCRFYVPVRTSTRKDLHPKGRSRITTYFDVYCFNPWTGAFVGKQPMEAVKEWEANSGFSSGLRPRR
jgi:hypothetical protein